jgi:hypothetical protein
MIAQIAQVEVVVEDEIVRDPLDLNQSDLKSLQANYLAGKQSSGA